MTQKVVGMLLIAISFFQLNAAFAQGSGFSGGGSWGKVPVEMEAAAKKLRVDFENTSTQELLDQQILKSLCRNNSCANLTEEQASKLLDRSIAFAKETQDQNDRREAKWMSRAGVGFTALGLLVAWLAYRQSRDADRRSIRNQTEIEQLKKI